MPTIPFTLDALAGLAIGVVFAFVCLRSMSRAVLWYVALGWIPFFQVATLSGSEVETGFMQAEWLATIMIVVWLLKRPPRRLHAVVPTRFNGPLLLLIPVSFVSLVSGNLGLDPLVEASHVKLAVSLGQIMLFIWPIGVYFVVANSVTTTDAIRYVIRLLAVLAFPSVALPFASPRIEPYLDWSIYFAFAASPFFFAASLSERSGVKKAAWLVLALAPVVYGFHVGKALWYVMPVVAAATIAALRARRLLLVGLPILLGAYLSVYVPMTGSWLPRPMQRVVLEEEAQQSLGGRAGREALAMDAIRIWTHYPLFGVGPGNVYPYMLRYSVLATAHSQYMNLLLELGIAGLACYLLFMIRAFQTGLDLFRSTKSRSTATFVLGWIGLFAGMAVGGLLGDFTLHSIRNDGLLVFSFYYPQWVMLGLMVAIKRIETQ